MMFENEKSPERVGGSKHEPGFDAQPRFENELSQDPTLKSQIVSHLPIALLVVGLAGTMMALHLAVVGVIALAAAHVVLGAILLAVKRHRVSTPAGSEA